MERAKQLAEEHWKYVETVIRTEWVGFLTLVDADIENLDTHCEVIGTHYKQAMIHGYKHGIEDARTHQPTM